MRKRILTVFLTICIILAMTPVMALSAETFCVTAKEVLAPALRAGGSDDVIPDVRTVTVGLDNSNLSDASVPAASVTADKTSVLPGETVAISGTSGADAGIVIKITDEAGNIVYFNAIKADSSGKYSASFSVPSNMAAGRLTVTAGSGNDVATTVITVNAPPAATAAPQPSASASASPSASKSATPSAPADATPDRDEPEAAGTDGGNAEQVITPQEISRDDETGVITIVIRADDLPEGTAAIETPDGKILYVSDAKNGVLEIKVTKDDISANGDIEITLLRSDMTPLSKARIRVPDENGEPAKTGEIAKTEENRMGGWMTAIWGAIGLIILAAVLWILIRRRKKQQQDD